MQHEGQQLLQGLSSTCEELSTSTSRRDQELQSLSQLLQSIKQLQDQSEGDPYAAQHADDAAAPLGVPGTAAQQHLLQLQRELLLQGAPAAPTLQPARHETAGSGSTGFMTMTTERDCGDIPAGAGATDSDPAAGSYMTALTGDGAADAAAVPAGGGRAQSLQADTAAPAQQCNTTWPRANLQELLRMDSSDSSAMSSEHCSSSCNAGAEAGSCTGSPRAAPHGDTIPAAAHADRSEDAAGSQDSPPLQQQGAASRFSFPGAGEQAVPLQYITPLKIPQPPGKCAGRAGSIPGSSGSRSSSPVGSFMQGMHAHAQHRPSAAAAGPTHAAARTGAVPAHRIHQHGGPAVPSGTQRHQVAGSRPGSSPCSRLPSPSAASSISSEAAALLQALQLAAEQRRITQNVLTAQSSLASGVVTATNLGSGGPGDQPTPSSRPQLSGQRLPAADEGAASRCEQYHASAHPASLPAGAGAAGGHQLQRQVLRGPSPHSPSPRSSPGTSVQGPMGPLPRSNSVLLLQRSAAERLLQDALDSSSFSSLLALLDSAPGSEEDEDEVQQQPQPQRPRQQHQRQQQPWSQHQGRNQQQRQQRQPAEQQRQGSNSQQQQHPGEQQQQGSVQNGAFRASNSGPADGLASQAAGSTYHAANLPQDAPLPPAQPSAAASTGAGASSGEAAGQPVLGEAGSRPPSLPGSHSTWGSCFSTPLGGNSTTHTPREQQLQGEGMPGKGPAAQPGLKQQALGALAAHQAPANGHNSHHHHQQQQQRQDEQHQQREVVQGAVIASPSPSLPLSSAVSCAASEPSGASAQLSSELEQLMQQVEAERNQLQQLRQQRSQLEAEVHAGSMQHRHQQQHGDSEAAGPGAASAGGAAAGPAVLVAPLAATAADEASPQSVYLECCAEQHVPDNQQQDAGAVAAAGQVLAAAKAPTSDAAVQCDDSCLPMDQQQSVQCADAGCQALLLHVADLPAVGPPIECRVCPLLHKQLQETQQRLEAALEQHKQAQLSAQQSRQQAMTAEAQLALSRQKLRQHVAAGAQPLAMSGWEDLVDEAAADLERVEGHVAAAAQRLIDLQASAASAAEALLAAQRESERQTAAATAATLKTEALQQQAEGLIAAISRNKQSSTTTQQDLQDLHQQLQEQQVQHATAREYLQQLQEQQQQLQAQVEASEQQLAERERQKQQVAAEVSEKQHALQVTRGECAAVQDKLSQSQASLIAARRQLEELGQAGQQQEQQATELSQHVAALRADRSAAAAEAHSAQQELQRVLRELEQCQKDIQASELQHAELEESAAARHKQQEEDRQRAADAQREKDVLEAAVAAAERRLQVLQQQAQAAKDEADLCSRAASAADRHLAQVQQQLASMQSAAAAAAAAGGAGSTIRASAPMPAAHTAAAEAASAMAAATAQMAECAQLQVRLAAADSRRQLAEERAEELERKVQQLRANVAESSDRREAAERQLRQVTAKADKARQKLQEKSEEAAGLQQQVQDLQEQLRTAQVQLHVALQQQDQLQQQQQQHAEDAHATGQDSRLTAQLQQQLALQQQKLHEAHGDCSALQQQLQEKAQQLSQQQQANSTLQQQLLEAQQQLVQAQQQLLQGPRQQTAEVSTQQQQPQQYVGPPSAAAVAAEQMHVAVHRSLHGMQELLQAQSQLQLAQLQAEHAKQQVQDLQSERRQLQKKLAACKQQLADTKAAHDASQQELLLLRHANTQQGQRQLADQQAADAAEKTEASDVGRRQQQQQQQEQELRQLQVQLAAAADRADSAQQQLLQGQQDAQHLQALLQTEQQQCTRLAAQVLQLQQEAAAAAAAAVARIAATDSGAGSSSGRGQGTSSYTLTFDAAVQTLPAPASLAAPQTAGVAAAAAAGGGGGGTSGSGVLENLQEQLGAARREAQQAVADREAAFKELQNALNSLHAAREQAQLLQQQLDSMQGPQQHQQGPGAAAEEQQQQQVQEVLLRQQEQQVLHLQQQLAESRQQQQELYQQHHQQLQQREVEAAAVQECQALLRVARTELDHCREQLAHAQADIQQLKMSSAAFEQQLLAIGQAALQETEGLLVSVQTEGRPQGEAVLSGAVPAVATPPVSSGGSGDGCPAVHGAGYGTGQQQVLQVLQQLAQACHCLCQQQQQQQGQQQQQSQQQQQQPGQLQQVQDALGALAASETKRQAAELAVLQLQQQLQYVQASLAQQQQQPGHAAFTSLVKSLEQLHQSAHAGSIPAGNASAGMAAAAASGRGKKSSAGGTMLPGTPRRTADPAPAWGAPASALASAAGSGCASLLAGPIPCVSPQLSVSFETQQQGSAGGVGCPAASGANYAGASAISQGCVVSAAGGESLPGAVSSEMAQLRERLSQLSHDLLTNILPASTASTLGYQHHQQQQQQQLLGEGGCQQEKLQGVAEGGAQGGLQWLKAQAAGHDQLMQHMRCMWEQASALAQHCMQLQAATASLEQQHTQLLAQQQQQHQQQSSLAIPHAAAQSAVTAVVQPLAALALQLQSDLEVLSAQHKALHAAARRVSSGFKAGGSIIRARAVELGASLERHCAGIGATTAAAGQQQDGKRAGKSGSSSLPLVVAAAVVQHWSDVEMLLTALQHTCDMMSNVAGQGTAGSGLTGQQDGLVTGQTSDMTSAQPGGGDGCSGSSSGVRRRAVKACRKLVEGLQQLAVATGDRTAAPAGAVGASAKAVAQQQQQMVAANGDAAAAPAGASATAAVQQRQQQQELLQELVLTQNNPTAGRLNLQPQHSQAGAGDSRPEADQQQQDRQQDDRQGLQHDRHSSGDREVHRSQPVTNKGCDIIDAAAPLSIISSCTAEGLGQLLAALQAQLSAAAGAAAAAGHTSEVGAQQRQSMHISSRRSSRTAALGHRGNLDGVPSSAEVVSGGVGHSQRSAVGAAGAVGRGSRHRSPKPTQQADDLGYQQQHRGSDRRSRAADVLPADPEPDEAVRASIRRVERAALLENIKLLQQHQRGRSLSQS